MWIIIVGNPMDGIGFYGPFVDTDTATTWADDQLGNMDWWVAPITQTQEDE